MKRIISIIAMMTASAALALSSAQTIHVLESEFLHCNDTTLVFSPHSDASVRNLPTLFLLHGWSGYYGDWNKHVDVQRLSDDTGFRIICPDGFYDSWYFNNADPAQMQWRDFFWNDLWPEMSRLYGLPQDKTFVDGLSMGGHGAMNLFLDHPELFRGAGSMSGVLDLKYSGGSKSRIPVILGAADIEDPLCTCQCAVNRLDRLVQVCGDDMSGKLLVVTCGQQDTRFFMAAQEFSARCLELGIRHISQYSPGKHRWPYWAWVVRQHIEWFRQEYSGEGIGEGERLTEWK